MTLTNKQYNTLFTAALSAADIDRYLAEWSVSSLFYPTPEADGPTAAELVAALADVWRAAHLSIKDIRTAANLSQAAFAERFCMPKSTLCQWEQGVRTAPDYLRLLLAEACGLVRRGGVAQ